MNIHSTFINKSPKLETNHVFTNKNISKKFLVQYDVFQNQKNEYWLCSNLNKILKYFQSNKCKIYQTSYSL